MEDVILFALLVHAFSMQDIFYKDNEKTGERRRVWASCHVDNFTVMAGGHEFRKSKSERMRFKVMHKVYDCF